ncbi:MAG: basic secretory protein-like protein [Verrucomicrobiia bacterium]
MKKIIANLLALLFAVLMIGQSGFVCGAESGNENAPINTVLQWTFNATNRQGEVIATISVDATETPDLANWARKSGELCAEWYPKIVELLNSEGFKPYDKIKIRFRNNMRGVAGTSRASIAVSADYVRKYTNDFGMIIHELTHIVQAYPEPSKGYSKPGWLVEGIADFIRIVHFEPQARRPRINPDRASYKDAYKTTAIFLEWAEKQYDKELVKKLNKPLREGKFKVEMFKEITGKTVDELWKEFTDYIRAQNSK